MKPLLWDAINPLTGTPFTYDDPNLRWGDPSYYLEPGDPGFVPYSNAPVTSKPKSRKVKRQEYFPGRIGDQIVWLRNIKTKLPNHATALGLVAGDVTNILLDVDTSIYGLDTYRGALGPASTSCYQCIETALYDDTVPGLIAWAGFTPPPGAPAARPHGCLRRIFAYISDVIKVAPGYTMVIGEDLGVEGPTLGTPDPASTAPEFDLRSTTGGKLEVLWTKKQFDGVRLEFDRGTAGLLSDMDLRPDYTLNWLPPAGQSAVIRVRLRYLYKGEDFGNWSDWQQWTLTGE